MRFAAVPSALQPQDYETTGVLAPPLVTLHTALDPIVPYWHEFLYRARPSQRLVGAPCQRPHIRYGHCAFTREELVFRVRIARAQVEGL